MPVIAVPKRYEIGSMQELLFDMQSLMAANVPPGIVSYKVYEKDARESPVESYAHADSTRALAVAESNPNYILFREIAA